MIANIIIGVVALVIFVTFMLMKRMSHKCTAGCSKCEAEITKI